MSQNWDYKLIRVIMDPASGANPTWRWEEDGTMHTNPPAILRKARELGNHGWERIFVTSPGHVRVVLYWFKKPK